MGFNKKFFSTGGIVAASPSDAAIDPLQNFETVTYTGNGGTQKITGYIRKGAAFNGSSSKVALSGSTSLTNRTISMWFNPSKSTNLTLLDNTQGKTSGSTQFGRWNMLFNYGGLNYVIWNEYNGSQYGEATFSYTFNVNTWYHIAFCVESGNNAVYVNGVSQTLTVTRGTSIGTVNLADCTLGFDRDSSSLCFDGKIDQVRIFNRALDETTDGEVTTLSNEDYDSSTKSTTDIFGDGSGVALYELDEDANDTGGVNGKFGAAAVFNGSSSVITPPAFGNTYPFTYSVWINPNSVGDTSIITDTISGNRFLFATVSSVFGRTNYFIIGQGGQNNFGTASNTVVANTWSHVVLVATSVNNYSVYINGVLQTLTNFGGSIGGTAAYAIGANGTGGEYFDGRIDDFRIYNDGLTSQEVDYIYNNTTASIPTDNLVAHYKLDGDATDETTNYDGVATNVSFGYDGTPTNVNFLGMAFQPDLVWIKSRDNGNFEHAIFDSVRGAGASKVLSSNTSNAEGWTIAAPMTSFDSNGFTVEPRSDSNVNNLVNKSGDDLVAWCWKAGGAAVSNTDGSITSSVSANQDAGFSIVKYTGSGANATVGHGLSSAPEMVIVKGLTTTYDWVVYHSGFTDASYYMTLNKTAAENSVAAVWNSTDPSSTNFSLGSNLAVNSNNVSHIAYCFHSVDGYQKVGSYTGTGAVNNQVNVGFQPRFVMQKRTDSTGSWNIIDNLRGDDNYLSANLANAEGSMTASSFHLTSTGFTLDNSFSEWNASGGTYIYLAIA